MTFAACGTLFAVLLGACMGGGPHFFGQYRDISPKVALPQGERSPRHLTVQLARPANVAVFLVVPGTASRLLFPQDSTQSQYIEAGSHLVETSLANGSLSDTSRLIRLPNQSNRPTNGRRNSGYPRDSMPLPMGFNDHGFLLIYASQEPLPYATLKSRVAGVSVPISDSDALNTVTKLIRETTHTTGPWAAYASDYPP
jgi:hypothetical protein